MENILRVIDYKTNDGKFFHVRLIHNGITTTSLFTLPNGTMGCNTIVQTTDEFLHAVEIASHPEDNGTIVVTK